MIPLCKEYKGILSRNKGDLRKGEKRRMTLNIGYFGDKAILHARFSPNSVPESLRPRLGWMLKMEMRTEPESKEATWSSTKQLLPVHYSIQNAYCYPLVFVGVLLVQWDCCMLCLFVSFILLGALGGGGESFLVAALFILLALLGWSTGCWPCFFGWCCCCCCCLTCPFDKCSSTSHWQHRYTNQHPHTTHFTDTFSKYSQIVVVAGSHAPFGLLSTPPHFSLYCILPIFFLLTPQGNFVNSSHSLQQTVYLLNATQE